MRRNLKPLGYPADIFEGRLTPSNCLAPPQARRFQHKSPETRVNMESVFHYSEGQSAKGVVCKLLQSKIGDVLPTVDPDSAAL